MSIAQLQHLANGSSQRIAFIDSGISQNQIDQCDIIYQYNLLNNNDDIIDKHGHGSKLFSLLVDKEYGIARNSQYIIIKIIDEEGQTDNELLYKALLLAHQYKADIINLSLGGDYANENVTKLINNLILNQCVIVASAGDYQDKDLLYPARLKGVISVSAYDRKHHIWKEANSHQDLVCAFPGVEIKVNQYYHSGTSEAAVLCTGYISILKDYYKKRGNNLNLEMIMTMINQLKTLKGDKVNYLSNF